MSATRIAELRQLITDSKQELLRLQGQLDAAVRRDNTWLACDLRGELQLAAADHEELVAELRGLEGQECIGQAVARGVRVADPSTSAGQFVDMLTAELMAMSDDEALEGQDRVELQKCLARGLCRHKGEANDARPRDRQHP